MIEVRVKTVIRAPIERCFDLARNLSIHTQTTGKSRERVIEGPDDGMMKLGDVVTFEAVHFGVRQRLTAKITEFDPPELFVDEQVRGAFKSLRHTHRFEAIGAATVMLDEIELSAPLGPLGWIAERVLLGPYMRAFITARGLALRDLAELMERFSSH
jgi:ligand-binding SRPBCC domain-containing protein